MLLRCPVTPVTSVVTPPKREALTYPVAEILAYLYEILIYTPTPTEFSVLLPVPPDSSRFAPYTYARLRAPLRTRLA
jgi:hypothetical protein